jgi:hypothetical protein
MFDLNPPHLARRMARHQARSTRDELRDGSDRTMDSKIDNVNGELSLLGFQYCAHLTEGYDAAARSTNHASPVMKSGQISKVVPPNLRLTNLAVGS